MISIIREVDKFMASPFHNRWIEDDFISVYVRKGQHLINGKMYQTFDVANVDTKPEYQGQGHFRNFMLKVESLGLPVYVECILNPELVTMLEKHGYEIIHSYGNIHAIKWTNND